LGVNADAVNEQMSKSEPSTLGVKKDESSEKLPENEAESSRYSLLEERLLGLAFQSDPEMILHKGISSLIVSPFARRIVEEYEKYGDRKPFDVAKFSKNLPKELFDKFARMVLSDSDENTTSADNLKKELDLVVKELKILSVREKLKGLSKEISQLESASEKEKLLKAQNKFTNLTQILSKLKDGQGGGIILEE